MPAPSGGQIDKLGGDLSCQPKRIRRRRPVRDYRLSLCRGDTCDDFLRSGCPRSKSRLDRPNIETMGDPHQHIALRESPQSLVDGRPSREMEESLRSYEGALGERLGLLENALGNRSHSNPLSENIV